MSMITYYVLDASVVARSILNPNSPSAKKLPILTKNPNNKFISPKLFIFEYGSIVRQNTVSESISREILEQSLSLPIKFLDFLEPDIYKALSLSWQLKESYYDCCYLHLALLHDCFLLTCDKKLFKAASHLGHIELWE